MFAAGSSWAVILWFPFSPEKVVTLLIAVFLLRLLFPRDEKTLRVLREEQDAVRRKMRAWKEKRNRKRRAKWLAKELAKRRQKNRLP